MRFVVVAVSLLLLLLFVCVPSVCEPHPIPFLVVSKSVSDDYVVVGDSVEFTVTVFNEGDAAAVDLTITDTLVDGTVRTKRVDSLSPGESAVLRYAVTPTDLGNYAAGVADVTYLLHAADPTKRRAYSNVVREGTAFFRGEEFDDESFRGVVSVVTRERYDRLRRRYVREMVAYAFLCVIPALFPFVVFRTKNGHVDMLIRRARATN